jgi:hypothetical protein
MIIIGFSIAAIGAWLEYFNGGSIQIAVACTLFAFGNILLVVGR